VLGGFKYFVGVECELFRGFLELRDVMVCLRSRIEVEILELGSTGTSMLAY